MTLRSLVLPFCVLICVGSPGLAQTLPVADAGEDQTVECAGPDGTLVTLDGSASMDPDDAEAELLYSWTSESLAEGETLEGVMPSVPLPGGEHVFSLVVDDQIDGASVNEALVTITIADTQPPMITLGTDALSLWPPNHKYHGVSAGDLVSSITDDCEGELSTDDVSFLEFTSDEPDNSNGDGNTTQDVAYAYGCHDALVRAERRGPSNGRVYLGTLGVEDAAGNVGDAVVTVSVPKSPPKGAVDDGPATSYPATPEACQVVDLCPPEPDPDCLPAERADLLLKARSRGDALRFRGRGFDVAADDLGEGEADTDYQLCVYVDDGVVTSVESDPAAPSGEGWKSSRSGQSYRGKGDRRRSGLTHLAIRSKGEETAVKTKGEGEGVDLPSLPIADGSVVTVQLHGSDGTCLEAVFDTPKKNSEKRYRARVR